MHRSYDEWKTTEPPYEPTQEEVMEREREEQEPTTAEEVTDTDIIEWVQGLIEALEMVGCTRAKGEEWVETIHLEALKRKLAEGKSAAQGETK